MEVNENRRLERSEWVFCTVILAWGCSFGCGNIKHWPPTDGPWQWDKSLIYFCSATKLLCNMARSLQSYTGPIHLPGKQPAPQHRRTQPSHAPAQNITELMRPQPSNPHSTHQAALSIWEEKRICAEGWGGRGRRHLKHPSIIANKALANRSLRWWCPTAADPETQNTPSWNELRESNTHTGEVRCAGTFLYPK